MEYIYAAMLLHKAGQKIEEGAVTRVLEAASVSVDATRVKALVAALTGVDIEKAIKEAVVAAPAAAAPVQAEAKHEEKKEKKEDEKKSEEAAAAGLGALFG
jgi:large subunit ribosomal protein L12